ncbi:MAG: hypothetical protein NE328_15710 [Lentisphaeraceae bacterium]|nr:hypothetical protein [Lentisphaeraceae bacterium]
MKGLLYLWIFCIFFTLPALAEKLYTRTYLVDELYWVLGVFPDGRAKPFVAAEFTPILKKNLESITKNYSDQTQIKLDEKKGLVHISSNLETIYQIDKNLSSFWNNNLKFHVEIIEVIDNSQLLKMNPLKITPTLIKEGGGNNFKTVSEFDILTESGEPGVMQSKSQRVKISPYLESDGNTIEVDFEWTQKYPVLVKYETRFSILDKASLAFQLQSKGEGAHKDLYMIISVDLLDYDLKPIKKFLKKDIVELKKKIAERKENLSRLMIGIFTIQAGMLEVYSNGRNHGLGGRGGLGDLDSQNDEFMTFKGYFISKGIKLGPESKLKFYQGAMRLHVTARVNQLRGIEEHLKELRERPLHRKINLRMIEVANNLLEEDRGGLTSIFFKNLDDKKIKILENFNIFAVSGKTVKIEEQAVSDKGLGLYVDLTTQLEPDNKFTSIDLKLNYLKFGISAGIDQSFQLLNDQEKVIELQNKNGKSVFVLISAPEYIPETKYWYD